MLLLVTDLNDSKHILLSTAATIYNIVAFWQHILSLNKKFVITMEKNRLEKSYWICP